MKPITAKSILLCLLALEHVNAFSPIAKVVPPRAVAPLSMSTVPATTTDDQTTEKGLFKRDRYVATNRFAVRQGQQAKFEKRWATRKSRLAQLPGFKYFHLMRRVTLNPDGTNTYDEGNSAETAQENYVSFTIWEKKSDFSAWRKGDAFKEAHGGTSITAFLSTMVNSALVLRGAPRPAFYDGLFTASVQPTTLPETVDGWRAVQADGVTTLPAECFVCMEKFYISGSKAAAFEQMAGWKKQQLALTTTTTDGFVTSSVMRRDGQAKGHGTVEMDPSEPTYVATYVFRDRPSLEKYMMSTVASELQKEARAFSDRASEKVFYEGTLVISSKEGA